MKRSTATASVQHAHHGWKHSRERRVPQCLAMVIAIFVLLRVPVLRAQQPRVSEYQVKATYLYNFARFVEWPAKIATAKSDSFAICVLGQDPFGKILDDTVAGETIGSKAVLAKRLSKPQDAVSCRVLYISSSEDSRLKEILALLEKAGVLTVSDIPQFSRRGGMIQFVLDGNKIRFEVNLASAEDAGLSLSSELLKVAITVRRNSQPGD
jgi:YfiR/HmsC-like